MQRKEDIVDKFESRSDRDTCKSCEFRSALSLSSTLVPFLVLFPGTSSYEETESLRGILEGNGKAGARAYDVMSFRHEVEFETESGVALTDITLSVT